MVKKFIHIAKMQDVNFAENEETIDIREKVTGPTELAGASRQTIALGFKGPTM